MNCASNIITANFSGGKTHATTARVYQWSRGIELCITGADNLPQTFKAHFSVQKRGGVATTIVGIDERVDVPNVLFTIGKDIHVWLGASETEDDAEILYTVDIPVAPAPMPEYYDAEDTGVFDEVVEQVADYAATATAAANSAGASATAAAGSASAAAVSASSAAGSATAAEQARADAVMAKGQAETAAQTATQKAQQTAQNASQAALDAGRAESAAERAESAETGAGAAKTAAEAAAQNAAASAATSDEKATLAGQSATAAAGSASAAAQSAASIEGDVQIASQKASEAQTAAGQAVTAKDAAVTAQQGAETAATNAGQSASTATAKASEAATSASGAAQSKTDAEAAAALAEQAAASLTVDSALSDSSTNPVQNKVITGEITDVKNAINVASDAVIKTANYERVSAGGYTAGTCIRIDTKTIYREVGNSFRLYNPIPVSEGDVYAITCSGYGVAAAYAFASDETTIVDVFPKTYRNAQSHIYTDELIVIPSGVAYLYVERNTQVTEVGTSVKKIIAPDYVKYTTQELTEEQMQIARANINAANADADDKIGLIGDGCDTVLSVALETGSGNRTPGETFTPTTSVTYRRKRFVPKAGVTYKIGTKSDYAVDANAHILALDPNDVILAQYGIYADVIGVLNETYVSFDSTVASVVVIVRATHNYIYLTECASVSDVYDNPVVGLLPIAKYNDESASAKKVATWLWFTDIHGDAISAKAINEFYSNNITQIVDVFNSGDVVLDVGTDSIADVMAYNACKKALFVVGNHDSSTKINDVRDWDGLSSAECYDKFIAPYVENWGTVVFGGTGLCYYYKDYASLGLRLIALDQSHWDATQKEWLSTILESAKSNNYSVLILSHYLPESTTGIPCNMTNYASPDADYSYYTLGGGDAGAIIQDWIDGGGKFVMWICGHSHRDRLGCCTASNDISVRQLTKASPDRTHNEYRDGKYRNAFELMTIDLNNGLVKFQRIGCNTDMWLTKKNVLVYDYIGHKVVTQF